MWFVAVHESRGKLKQEVFEGKFGRAEAGTMKLEDFIDQIYMAWAKTNKKSWLIMASG
jgi:hypothetical protein